MKGSEPPEMATLNGPLEREVKVFRYALRRVAGDWEGDGRLVRGGRVADCDIVLFAMLFLWVLCADHYC